MPANNNTGVEKFHSSRLGFERKRKKVFLKTLCIKLACLLLRGISSISHIYGQGQEHTLKQSLVSCMITL